MKEHCNHLDKWVDANAPDQPQTLHHVVGEKILSLDLMTKRRVIDSLLNKSMYGTAAKEIEYQAINGKNTLSELLVAVEEGYGTDALGMVVSELLGFNDITLGE